MFPEKAHEMEVAQSSQPVFFDKPVESYSEQERTAIRDIYNNFLRNNHLLVSDYLAKFGVKYKVGFEFVSDNENLKDLKQKKSRSRPKSVPTAVFVVEQTKDGLGKNSKVYMGLDFFIRNKFTKEEVFWILLHEMTHYKDYEMDKRTYMHGFEEMKEAAKKAVDELVIEYEKAKQTKIEDRVKGSMVATATKMLQSTYLNIVEDISVNHHTKYVNVFNKKKKGKFGDTISNIYNKALFKDRDFSTMPESFQYVYAMLISEFSGRGERDVIDGGAGSRTTEEVKAELSRMHSIKDGEKLDTQQIIDAILNPHENRTIKRKGRDLKKSDITKIKERHEILNQTFLPSFLRLMKIDFWRMLESGDFDKANSSLEDLIDSLSGSSPDFMGSEEMEDLFDEIDKAGGSKATEDPKETKHKDWLKRNNFGEDLDKYVKEVTSSIETLVMPLRQAWEMLRLGRREILKIVHSGEARQGKFSVNNFVRQIPNIIKQNFDSIKLFNKRNLEVEKILTPEELQIQLVMDLSASQFDESDKLKTMQQIYLMVKKSIEEFNENVRTDDFGQEINLKADTGVIAFGSKIIEVESFGQWASMSDMNTYKLFELMQESLGSTDDVGALNKVLETIDEPTQQKITDKRIVRIVIFLTDGGGDNSPESLKDKVNELQDRGLKVVAFHIGGEQITMFRDKWNTDASDPDRTGIVVRKVEDLPSQVSEYITTTLNKVV